MSVLLTINYSTSMHNLVFDIFDILILSNVGSPVLSSGGIFCRASFVYHFSTILNFVICVNDITHLVVVTLVK